MKKYRIILMSVIISSIIIIILVLYNMYNADIRYLKAITKVKLPNDITEISIYHPREFCFAGKLRLNADDASMFIEKNGFALATNFPMNAYLGIEKEQFKYLNTNMYKLTDNTSTHQWEFAFDPRSNELWFILFYADYHGDPK